MRRQQIEPDEAAPTNGHRPRLRADTPLAQLERTAPVVPRIPAQRTDPAGVRRPDEPAAAMSVSVVIPAWNEAANIERVLQGLTRFDDILLVDAFSSDGTLEAARRARPDVRVLQRPPRGKGDALRAGFAEARGDVIVIMDADGSMDPAEVDVFLAVLAMGFDLVKGSRLACGGGSHDLTRVRSLGNAALCRVANVLFQTRWTDLCYGFLAFRRSCLPQLALTADGFEIECQILGHAALAGLRIAEVPSVEMNRWNGDSHLRASRDGTRVLHAMLAARFAPRPKRVAAALRPPTPY